MCSIFGNDCKYPSCAKVFSSLPDLITHIEQDHLDFSSEKVKLLEDEIPECLPLSYVLKFSNDDALTPPFSYKNKQLYNFSESVMTESFPFPGCDFKEKQVVNAGTVNELRLNEEFSSLCKNRILFITDNNHKKPFACNMPGCHKRYKNINGIKYHYKNYHKLGAPSAIKRSVLKFNNSAITHSNIKLENGLESQGLPIIASSQPNGSQFGNDLVYHNISALTRFEEASQTGYFFNLNNILSTSNEISVSDQVPLQTMSFNFIGDIGESAAATSSHYHTKY